MHQKVQFIKFRNLQSACTPVLVGKKYVVLKLKWKKELFIWWCSLYERISSGNTKILTFTGPSFTIIAVSFFILHFHVSWYSNSFFFLVKDVAVAQRLWDSYFSACEQVLDGQNHLHLGASTCNKQFHVNILIYTV